MLSEADVGEAPACRGRFGPALDLKDLEILIGQSTTLSCHEV